jgi:phosphoglycerate kinase
MINKKTIRDIDITGKTVLLRTDYNVPMKDGKITDDYRIKQSLETIEYLLSKDCKIIICSHLGRPKGPKDTDLSLFPVAKRLKQLLDKDVEFVTDCIGPNVERVISKLKNKQVLLLENLRFHKEEEANDDDFAKQLASNAEIFVQDAFGVVHRAHASTVAITHHLPSVAGLLLEREVDTITKAITDPAKPLITIIGGAKIADKIEVLTRFIEISDFVAVGGAMAINFLKAEGIDVGDSLIDKDDIPLAKSIINKAEDVSKTRPFNFIIPFDAVVANKVDPLAPTRIVDWSTQAIADIENYPKRPNYRQTEVLSHEKILDIGPFTGAFIAGAIQLSATVIWNGAMGVTETEGHQGPIGPYSHGTDLIVKAMTGDFGRKPFTIVGGGDTVGYIESHNLLPAFNHVSTGGGASMELLAGHKLPGIEALLSN